jgi:UDP-glucose 4-epimerase
MIIVTGGLGFIGNELVRQLDKQGKKVVVLDNKNRIAPEISDLKHIPVEEINIADYPSVSSLFSRLKPELVFHMAAIHFIPECNADPERTLRINVEGTQSILRASSENKVGKIVFASSGAVYADSAQTLNENFNTAPIDVYGWSKLFGENLCQLNHSLHATPTVVARLFNNYGPRETNPHIVPEIIKQVRSGSRLKLGNISTVRDYIHTRDCASALIRLSQASTEGVETVNVATGKGFTVKEIIEKIGTILKMDIDIEFDNTRVRKFDKQTQVADIATLQRLTGWSPAISIEDGLTDLLRFEKLL